MKKALVCTFLTMATFTWTSGAAAHADSRNSIRDGVICLYEHDNYKGGQACFGSHAWDLSWTGGEDGVGRNWNGTNRAVENGASSVKNNSRYWVFLYDGRNYKGTFYKAKPYSSDADLTKNSGNPSFDNRTSSLAFKGI
ncbi:peptidase inhibitor family I36 protein [Nonomuraea sp. KM88]|uniref:peptidase inhibitor family I36 protein n=1 Tax=Nonomuraea sp. KM88 TaxID=3457427 RepID=UPI003FCD6DC5